MAAIVQRIRRHNVFIRQVLNGTGEFDVTINVPFPVTEMRVVQLGFRGIDIEATPGLFHLRCDALANVSPGNLGIISDPTTQFMGITYPMTAPPAGVYHFQVQDASGGISDVPDILLGANLMLHLEFRQYN